MEVNGEFCSLPNFGLEFLAKAKPLRPRPRTNITDYIYRPMNIFATQFVMHL